MDLHEASGAPYSIIIDSMNKTILVAGGGISGLTAAVEAAEAGFDVLLIEKNPYLGGKVAQVNLYFPKLCSPVCGLEIIFQRLAANTRFRFLTSTEVLAVAGREGYFEVTVRFKPTFVNENCTGCGKCAEVCPAARANGFNCGLDQTRAAYLPHRLAYPFRYVIDGEACWGSTCARCADACPYGAIDLGMEGKTHVLKAASVIWAAGWDLYDTTRLGNYGGGRYPNVITNIMVERMAAPDGPTGGKILRPSDGREPGSVAFVQCAGSRDDRHLGVCSGVCCLVSLKQAAYIRERSPGARIAVFYIDLRARGFYEDFFVKVRDGTGIELIKGKPGEITEDPATGNLLVLTENQLSGQILEEKFELVVLAAGMAPAIPCAGAPVRDGDGFVSPVLTPGFYAAGCAVRPMEVAPAVRSGAAAALRAVQWVRRRDHDS
ncbi:MAG: ribulose-1,5-biphosphate synthetase [Firmicutes bacterium ADurb.Bin456]|nr:MAG: ribulose-1,5-biphosphate synthetase [Firmicutes bacterium ADurb.Bin456]